MVWLRNIFGEKTYYLEDTLGAIYDNQILNSTMRSSGGGQLEVHPDGSEYNYFRLSTESVEWVVLWTKPDYGNKFIGIHKIHNGEYPTKQWKAQYRGWKL